MIYGKEFYETLLNEFLIERHLYTELPKNLPDKYPVNSFDDIYYNVERWYEEGDDSWEEWRNKMLEETKERLAKDFRIFSDQLYQKHYTTPGGLCGELALMIAQATELLPHKFRVALRDLTYYESHDTETIFVWVVFIDEELLKELN